MGGCESKEGAEKPEEGPSRAFSLRDPPLGGRTPCKIVLAGGSGVGKSCMSIQFRDSVFRWELAPTSSNGFVFKKDLSINTVDGPKLVDLTVWDTAGEERYSALTANHFRGARGALVVYSVDDRLSFERTRHWIERVLSAAPGIPVTVVANKIDLVADRVVSRAEGEALARELGTGFEETSAKTGENVLRVFEDITLRATDTREQA